MMEGPPPESMFRASKRRKVMRKRPTDDDGDDQISSRTPVSAHPTDNGAVLSAAETPTNGEVQEEEDQDAYAEQVLRQRRPLVARRRGIGFSTSSTPKAMAVTSEAVDASSALVPIESTAELAAGRFVAPTGHIASTDDKHMMAYIDSKLASIRSQSAQRETIPATTAAQPLQPVDAATKEPTRSADPGGLQEVDLGPSATSNNVALTDAARRRLEGTNDPTPSQQPEKRKPIRLGRDGKPLRPRRQPARRTSDDLARDAMVDAVFSEARLGIYDESSRQAASNVARTGQDEDADERMVEEFKREFMANQEERNSRKAPPPPPGAKGESLKGPKMGGSRSQRAAMRAIEEKAAAKGKK